MATVAADNRQRAAAAAILAVGVFSLLWTTDAAVASSETSKPGAADELRSEFGSSTGLMDDRLQADQPLAAVSLPLQAAAQSQCVYPCKCSKDPPRCKTAKTIKDGCDCCHICPRQQGDLCDYRYKCDEDRGLYCDFVLDEGHRGICRAKAAKSCDVDGKTFKDGEEFKPNCSLLCTCQNGQYACASLCPQEERPPSRAHCRDAQLVPIVGQCCREWVCPHAHSLAQPDDESHNIAVVGVPMAPRAERCIKESTNWSACSVTCGMGVSIRVTNNNNECKSMQEERLCLIRPCDLNDKLLSSTQRTGGSNKCRSTWREPEPGIRLRLSHDKHKCTSVNSFRLKYCTTCKRNRCCGPGRTKTLSVLFDCPDGKNTSNFMWIGNCECKATKNCGYTVVYD